jgi:hypothetical protein
MKILARPVRRPLARAGDLAQVQRYLLTRVDEEIVWRARVSPRLVLVCDDHLEDLDLDHTDGDPLATFQRVEARRDVRQRVLCGTATTDDGRLVGFVFAASNRPDGAWWLASRVYRKLPGGLGSSDRMWDVGTGVGLEELPVVVEQLRGAGPPCDLLPARSLPWPQLGCRVQDLPSGPAPLDALGATQVLAQRGVETELWRRGLDSVLIAVFRRDTLERWTVDGEIPFTMDELVRAVCAMGPRPDAVATVRIELFDDHGVSRRAVRTVAEAGAERVERLLVLDFESEDQVTPDLRLYGTQPAQVGAEGWIGVRPGGKVELTPQVAEA